MMGRRSTSDLEVDMLQSEKAYCIKPDQFELGTAALLNIHPECHSRLEYNSGGKVCGTCNSITGLKKTEARPYII